MHENERFMVYELDDSGEKKKVEVAKDGLQSFLILYPEQVFVIIREDLRKIFIWKGPRSPIRKRFVSSRTTIALQEELRRECGLLPCKIISVDVGDEPLEFLSAFSFPPSGNALRKIMRMMGDIRELTLTRKFLPEMFTADLLENSKTDGDPTFKPFTLEYFKFCGILTRVHKTEIIFFEDKVNLRIS
ncbi:MAG: hypothetical protein ACXAC5_23510 [Promethearchaeota archaeon]|jgi:hypothetical protein